MTVKLLRGIIVVVKECVYVNLLLCLREGEAEGEGTEVLGAGMGHLRTGSSTILLSISSILYSTWEKVEKCEKIGQMGKGGDEKWRVWKEEKGILLAQYNSMAISMVNSLCCIQFTLHLAPQIQFAALLIVTLLFINAKELCRKRKRGRRKRKKLNSISTFWNDSWTPTRLHSCGNFPAEI